MKTNKPTKNEAHWTMEDYRQRMTSEEWKRILLASEDTIIFRGKLRRLVAKNIGHGVVEVYKSAIPISEGE